MERDQGRFHGGLGGEHALKPGHAFCKGRMKRAVLSEREWTRSRAGKFEFRSIDEGGCVEPGEHQAERRKRTSG